MVEIIGEELVPRDPVGTGSTVVGAGDTETMNPEVYGIGVGRLSVEEFYKG